MFQYLRHNSSRYNSYKFKDKIFYLILIIDNMPGSCSPDKNRASLCSTFKKPPPIKIPTNPKKSPKRSPKRRKSPKRK